MKLGFSLPMAGPWATPDNQVLVAQRAETLGYHSLWVFQRLLYAIAPRNDYPPLPGQPWPIADGQRVEVPTAYAAFPKEIVRPPRSWAERVYNIRRWTVMPAGGHFAALEEPQALVDDLRAFFRDLR